jgi:hypothetical protein
VAAITIQPAIMARVYVMIVKITLKENIVKNASVAVMAMQHRMDASHVIATIMVMKNWNYVIKRVENVFVFTTLRAIIVKFA